MARWISARARKSGRRARPARRRLRGSGGVRTPRAQVRRRAPPPLYACAGPPRRSRTGSGRETARQSAGTAATPSNSMPRSRRGQRRGGDQPSARPAPKGSSSRSGARRARDRPRASRPPRIRPRTGARGRRAPARPRTACGRASKHAAEQRKQDRGKRRQRARARWRGPPGRPAAARSWRAGRRRCIALAPRLQRSRTRWCNQALLRRAAMRPIDQAGRIDQRQPRQAGGRLAFPAALQETPPGNPKTACENSARARAAMPVSSPSF